MPGSVGADHEGSIDNVDDDESEQVDSGEEDGSDGGSERDEAVEESDSSEDEVDAFLYLILDLKLSFSISR